VAAPAASRHRRLEICFTPASGRISVADSRALAIAQGATFYQWQSAILRGRQGVFRSLTFDFAASLGSGGDQKAREMQITEVTDSFQKAKATLDEFAKANPDDSELLGIQAAILDEFIDGYTATGGYNWRSARYP